jgi:hypothetical protein
MPHTIDTDAPTTSPGPRKRKLAARLADQDNVARPVLKQQRVAQLALQQNHEFDNTSTGNTVSDSEGPLRAQGTHLPHPKGHKCRLEVADSSEDDDMDDPPVEVPSAPTHKRRQSLGQSESDSSSNEPDLLKEFVPKKRGMKREAAPTRETETPEQELGVCCMCFFAC